MPAFAWKGKNRMGEVQEGLLVSDSKDAATLTLKRNGIQLISIKAQQSAGTKSFGKVKAKDLAIVLEATQLAERDIPDYVEVSHTAMTAKLVRVPALSDVPYPVQMEPHFVVEYYSR